MCYDPAITTSGACVSSGSFHPEWKSDWKAGSGLCRVHYKAGSVHTKVQCEAKTGLKWWEGRTYAAGDFNTPATCTGYCNDGNWPPKKTCGADTMQCNTQCAQCVPGDPAKAAVCIHNGITTQDTCSGTSGYEWDWYAKICLKKTFSSKSNCEATALHKWFTCGAREQAKCGMAYCKSPAETTMDACWTANKEWQWGAKVCSYSSWKVNNATSVACSSLSSSDTCENVEGCSWSGSACSGTSKGCNQQAGGVWVDPDPASTIARKSMQCRWNEWELCKTNSTCKAAGECEDWSMQGQGACIVKFAADSHGYRQMCSAMKGADGAEYQDSQVGCIAKNTAGRVNETVCGGITGGTWHNGRAENKAQCDAYGKKCRNKFEEWDIFGGFTDQTKCTTCGHVYQNTAKFHSGVWSQSPTETLTWAKRAYAKVNQWDEYSVDREKFQALLMNGVGQMMAQARKTQIMCLFNPIAAAILPIAEACGTTPISPKWTEISAEIATQKISCGNAGGEAPIALSDGGVDMAGATCADLKANTSYVDLKIQKVSSTEPGTSGRRGGVCAAHEVIKNANLGLCGQKMGNGLKLSGVSGVKLCLATSVPTAEVCSKYTVKDVAELGADGKYGPPMGKTITLNAQGYYCFQGAQSGIGYVPILRVKDYNAVAGVQISNTKIVQEVSFTKIAAADWKGDVKAVYETGYGISLAIYDTAAKKYKTGCSVSSQATAARRAGVKVAFTASVENSLASAATISSKALASNPGTLVAAVQTAITTLGKASTVTAPSVADVSVAAPVVVKGSLISAASRTAGQAALALVASAVAVLLAGNNVMQ